jgi:hypothetical protein
MWCGHDPSVIEDYAWADVANFLNALPALIELQQPFGGESP